MCIGVCSSSSHIEPAREFWCFRLDSIVLDTQVQLEPNSTRLQLRVARWFNSNFAKLLAKFCQISPNIFYPLKTSFMAFLSNNIFTILIQIFFFDKKYNFSIFTSVVLSQISPEIRHLAKLFFFKPWFYVKFRQNFRHFAKLFFYSEILLNFARIFAKLNFFAKLFFSSPKPFEFRHIYEIWRKFRPPGNAARSRLD